jgi:hypothetical protein
VHACPFHTGAAQIWEQQREERAAGHIESKYTEFRSRDKEKNGVFSGYIFLGIDRSTGSDSFLYSSG